MAEIRLTWDQANEIFCNEAVRFQTNRAAGLDVEQAAAAISVNVATGVRYERMIDRLMADLKTSAAPGRPGPEAAEPAHDQ
jgi:hypothetical protein